MEVTCSRCHQTVQPGDCFCPFCGLPQLVYTADGSAAPGQPERVGEPIRDAATIDWKPALRLALSLAIPAGALCSMYSPAGILHCLDGCRRRVGRGTIHAQPPPRMDHHWSRRAHRPRHRHSRQLGRRPHHRNFALRHALLAAPWPSPRCRLAEPIESRLPILGVHGLQCPADRAEQSHHVLA